MLPLAQFAYIENRRYIMKLSDYKPNTNQSNASASAQKEELSEKDLQDKYNQYKDMSQSELNSELFKEVARQKSQGTFDYQKLASMLESLRGSLSEENYQNIKRIMESLK